MVMLFPTSSWPLVSVIVCPFSDELKLIVSPSTASASAWRSEPGPLSFVFMTVNVAPRRLGKPTAPTLSNAIRRRIRVCFIDAFLLVFLVFGLLHLGHAFFLAVAQMCFYPLKRKSRLKPAKLFHRLPIGRFLAPTRRPPSPQLRRGRRKMVRRFFATNSDNARSQPCPATAGLRHSKSNTASELAGRR